MAKSGEVPELSEPGSFKVVLVVAAARNGVIGDDGDMPWRMPSSLRRFRQLTMGRPMIMGRKTYQAIGRPLEGRDSIVVTRDPSFRPEGVHAVDNLADAFAVASRLARARGTDEIVVAGGGEIYRATLPFAHIVQLDEIDATPTGDTTFPQLNPGEWREAARSPMARHERDQYGAEAVTMVRIGAPRSLTEA